MTLADGEQIFEKGHGNKFGLVPGKGTDPKKFVITKIEYLQNPVVWRIYAWEKVKMRTKYNSVETVSEYLHGVRCDHVLCLLLKETTSNARNRIRNQ